MRYLVGAGLVASAVAIWTPPQGAGARAAAFSVVEATISDMQRAMREHRVTSRELVTQYLSRIAMYDKRVNATIAINPHALEDADARDRERAAGHVRGPLHGIPIALKDNIHTTDVTTTGGALAFANFTPPFDATLTKNLRDAGAVILAKTVHHGAGELGRGRADADARQLQRSRRVLVQSVRRTARPARVERWPSADDAPAARARVPARRRASGPRTSAQTPPARSSIPRW